ncbi:MAG: UDP-N-acetylmuramoyl-tripeptide--D-alanyl-D-alanine ligase [Ferruginibacter sp.]|nr:UDP-N-acetylmuramoyl-tripeptide--D-alanyl-D-alanine ligase [Ferruginibacter sp.]
MQIEDLYKLFLNHPSVQTDTRKIKKDDLFFALKGENFNGNLFAQQAIELGAAYAIVDEDINTTSAKIIKVKDVLQTLQSLAQHHREQFNTMPNGRQVPFIAITGSNGKTTTKELIHQVLTTSYKTYTTEGNLNNHIGIPLTILKIKKDVEIAVIEMGANHQKEIEGYCKYAQPTHGLITNCGKAHLEGFGGVEGIRKGKGELFDYLRTNNGTCFIMKDYDYLIEMSKGIASIFSYGTANADIVGNVLQNDTFLQVDITQGITETIKTQLVGSYNLPNVLAAVAIGTYFKVDAKKIKQALESYTPSNSRSQLIKKDTNTIILDAYNANPSSMKLAIENFAKVDANKKILLLGGMMELGNESKVEHQAIVDLLKMHNWQNVVLVGGDFKTIPHPYTYFDTSTLAKEWMHNNNFIDTYFLIKGSRSMQMEKVLE